MGKENSQDKDTEAKGTAVAREIGSEAAKSLSVKSRSLLGSRFLLQAGSQSQTLSV